MNSTSHHHPGSLLQNRGTTKEQILHCLEKSKPASSGVKTELTLGIYWVCGDSARDWWLFQHKDRALPTEPGFKLSLIHI
eukprot:4402020-Prorocentrum_lima.AAC.1